MSADQKPLGAHGGGIPPGWDFPEARAAADEGLDLWLLDWNLKRSVWERIEDNYAFSSMVNQLRDGIGKYRTDEETEE